MFQHTAARRRLQMLGVRSERSIQFQHTAARRRLQKLSTFTPLFCRCFNTQPPEGGCGKALSSHLGINGFNTQPPEGGCLLYITLAFCIVFVSTHSRPKAAAFLSVKTINFRLRFNTQPPEGGCTAKRNAASRH